MANNCSGAGGIPSILGIAIPGDVLRNVAIYRDSRNGWINLWELHRIA